MMDQESEIEYNKQSELFRSDSCIVSQAFYNVEYLHEAHVRFIV